MYRNLGRFLISIKLLEENISFVQKVMKEVVPIRAESRYDKAAIEYIAISKHFDMVPSGNKIPQYIINFFEDKNGYIKWNFWPLEF